MTTLPTALATDTGARSDKPLGWASAGPLLALALLVTSMPGLSQGQTPDPTAIPAAQLAAPHNPGPAPQPQPNTAQQVALATTANASLTTFDIAQQPLAEALVQFAQQANVSVVAPTALTKTRTAAAVSGQYEVLAGLQRLLADHCLEAVQLTQRSFSVRQRQCEDPTAKPNMSNAGTQHQGEQPTQAIGIEQVLVRAPKVTGSRLRTPAFADSSPLTVITRPQIELMGFQSLAELLRYLPSVAGNATSTLISNGGNGSANVTLRGLPAGNTLVLVNGRRFAPEAFDGAAADLNSLPLAQVERVDVFTDGASAIYGSDAVAGVVNVITDRQFDGLAFTAYSGRTQAGDLPTNRLALTVGRTRPTWHANLGVSWYDQGKVASRDRRISRSSNDLLRGGIDKRSSATVPARFAVNDSTLTLEAAVDDLPYELGDFRDVTDDDRFEFRDYTTAIVPSQRWSSFASGEIDIASISLFAQLHFTVNESTNQLAPTPLFTGFETEPIQIGATALGNPFGQPIQDLRRRFVELGPRRQENRAYAQRLVLGVTGGSGSWSWELSGMHTASRGTETRTNLLQRSAVQAAVADGCNGTCQPLNLFGPAGSIDAEALADVSLRVRNRARTRLDGANLLVDYRPKLAPEHPLFGFEVSAGLEYRQESINIQPAAIVAAGDSVGGTNFGRSRGDRNIIEGYTELYLPLINNDEGQPILAAQVAARVTDYSEFASRLLPRYVLQWQPHDLLSLRATYAKGFRAPSLKQLYAGPTQSFESLNDPCSDPGNVGRLPGCQQLADSSLTQVLTVTGGEPDLSPERTNSYSLAVLLQPNNRLELGATYYQLRQANVVDSSEQFIINQNANSLSFGNRIARDASGNLTQVFATLLNIGRRKVRGIDISGSAKFLPKAGHSFTTAINATRILEFTDQVSPDLPAIDQAGTFSDQASNGNGALPHWKVNLGVTWAHSFWQAYYNWYWVSGLNEIVPVVATRRRIGSWQTQNVQLSYLGPATAFSKLTFGVNNLMNEAPPFSAAAFNDSYDGRTYDLSGRYWYLRWSKQW